MLYCCVLHTFLGAEGHPSVQKNNPIGNSAQAFPPKRKTLLTSHRSASVTVHQNLVNKALLSPTGPPRPLPLADSRNTAPPKDTSTTNEGRHKGRRVEMERQSDGEETRGPGGREGGATGNNGKWLRREVRE